MSKYPKKVKIVEVSPRDGLQNESTIVTTEDKVHFINLLSESGLPVIESGSFVHPKWVPQLADASSVFAQMERKAGVSYPALVPNLKGLERALQSGVKEIAVFTAASETFNGKNINRTIQESLAEISEIVDYAKRAKLSIRGYVSTCFVCPYEGKIAPEKVSSVVDQLLQMGIDELSIGDTIGAAVPTDVEKLFSLLLKRYPQGKLAVHFHDTRGAALANVLTALQMGITTVDSSAGGLGGCPYAPGASGNVATEDVLYMLHGMEIKTGVSLEKVAAASQFMGKVLRKPLSAKFLQLSGSVPCV